MGARTSDVLLDIAADGTLRARRGLAEKVVVVDHDGGGVPRLLVRWGDRSDDAPATGHLGGCGGGRHRRQLESQFNVALDRQKIIRSEEYAGTRDVFGRAMAPQTLTETPVAHRELKGESGRPHDESVV